MRNMLRQRANFRVNSHNPFVHPEAICDSDDVGNRTRIWAFAHVMSGVRIGSSCNIGEGVFVETGASIGDGVTVKNGVSIWDLVTLESEVFVGPNAVFTNDLNPRASVKKSRADLLPTRVCRGATIGANATIVCGVTIGEFAMVGAGSVVTRSINPYELVIGNPARVVGFVCECGLRLEGDLKCECGAQYILGDDRHLKRLLSSDEK